MRGPAAASGQREREGDRIREKREECQESHGKLTLTICIFVFLCLSPVCDSSFSVFIFNMPVFQSVQ